MTIPPNVLIQIMMFLKVFVWGILIIESLIVASRFLLFNYLLELNKRTGSGIIIKKVRARKKKDRNGNFFLKTITGKTFMYPKDDGYIYRYVRVIPCWLIRFYERTEGDYHPMQLKQNETDSFMEPIPQNIKFLYKSDQEAIDRKYEKEKNFVQQYGQMIGVGILIVGFIIAIYFIMNQVEQAIQLGSSSLELAARLSGQAIQGLPPP